MNSEAPQYWGPREAARFLGLSPSTLAKMRSDGSGPPYRVLCRRKIAYRPDDLIRWAESRVRISTTN